jgi:hypothetical protein
MSNSLRVTSTDPRLTRVLRSYGAAEERALRLVRLVGQAEIQRRGPDGAWKTVETFERIVPARAGR